MTEAGAGQPSGDQPVGEQPTADLPPQPGGAETGAAPARDAAADQSGAAPAGEGRTAPEQGRGHLDPEPRPGAEEKPGLLDKVRGKVEDLRGREDDPRT